MNNHILPRVAVTGLGIITSIGESIPEFRKGLLSGKCGIGPVSLFNTSGFPATYAAQVKKAELNGIVNEREAKRMSRCDLLGLVAAGEAMTDTGLDSDKAGTRNIGVVLGGGAGGMLSWEHYRRSLWSGEIRKRPSLLLPCACCSFTDLLANRYRLTGTRTTVATACSSSATAIGVAFDLIQTGIHEMVITGGSEALSELTFAGFNALRVMDPAYCRPFDKNRKGLSLGEGAAILVLENYDRARERGATIYAEMLGYATNSDAFHMTSPDPDAMGMSRVMERALERSGVDTNEVDYINAHGTGTRSNDPLETRAIKRVFGDKQARDLAVSSTKSMVGHCLGAGGAIEATATILAICEQVVPPTLHLEEPDPECDLDYVPGRSTPRAIRIAMSNSFAFGGNNTALLFGKGGNEKPFSASFSTNKPGS